MIGLLVSLIGMTISLMIQLMVWSLRLFFLGLRLTIGLAASLRR